MADSPAIVAESVVEKIKPLRLLILKGLSGADGIVPATLGDGFVLHMSRLFPLIYADGKEYSG